MRVDIIMFLMVSLGLFKVGLDDGLALWVGLVLAILYHLFLSIIYPYNSKHKQGIISPTDERQYSSIYSCPPEMKDRKRTVCQTPTSQVLNLCQCQMPT